MRHLKRDRHGEMEFRTMVLLAALIIIFAPVAYVLLMNPSPNYNSPSSISEASYFIYKSSGSTYAVNGQTASVDFSGAVSSDVIQDAIDSLTSTGGKIQISSGQYYLASSLTLKDNVTLAGNGPSTMFYLSADIPAVTIIDTQATVTKDIDIYVYNGQTQPVILLQGSAGARGVGFNDIEGINIHNDYSPHGLTNVAWSAIELLGNGPVGLFDNKFSDIRTLQPCGRLIDIRMTDGGSYINGNTFKDMWANGFYIGVDFANATGGYESSLNQFTGVQLEAWPYSVGGFHSIWRFQNTFTNCVVWDWINGSGHQGPGDFIYSFSAASRGNFVSAPHLIASEVNDPGWENSFTLTQWVNFNENYGRAYISPGTTSVVVTHDMGVAPNLVFTAGENNNTAMCYVDYGSITSTTFTIDCWNSGGGWVEWHAVHRTTGF